MMKRKLPVFLMLSAPGVAMAEATTPSHMLTANVGLVSDYLYRGISQTNAKPAIQGGLDYAHSGDFYAGVWGSSISWLTDSPAVTGATSSQVEIDTYFGFKNSFTDGITYDVGFLRYNYPASYATTLPAGAAKADTDEIYGALGYKFITAKLSYSLGNAFGIDKSRGSTYLDLSANIPLATSGYTVCAHLGRQAYQGAVADGLAAINSNPSYTDYRVGISKELSGFVIGLAYSSTDANRTQYTNGLSRYLGRGTAVLSLSRSF